MTRRGAGGEAAARGLVGVRGLALASALVTGLAVAPARADFVRGSIKVDVRDAGGKPVIAAVAVRPSGGGEAARVSREGDVYVAEGLVEGAWTVAVAGAPPQEVHMIGHRSFGVVVVLGASAPLTAAPPRRSKSSSARGKRERGAPAAAPSSGFTRAPGETDCVALDGLSVEAVAFTGDGLGAGKVEVREVARRGKRPLTCSAIIAGGSVSLRLPPGTYDVIARFVGGASAHESYHLAANESPRPLALRAR